VLKEARPHIVHGHDWLARSFLPLRRWSRWRFGTRFVSSLHYYTLSCAKKNLMQSIEPVVEVVCSGPAPGKCLRCSTHHYGWIVGATTVVTNAIGAVAEQRASDALITVSAATARGNRLVPEQVEVVPNFLPPGHSPPAVPPAEVTRLVARLPAEPFLLFVGDLRPMKGLDVLLAAHRDLRRPMRLVLIGKRWPDTPSIPPGVDVFEHWPNAAVLEAWRRCSIAVVPSVWSEPFGIVVIEAMAAGRPVVASSVGGIGEIIEDGVSGVLVQPGDVEAWRLALDALIADPQRQRRLGAAAAERAARFAAATVVPEVEAVYARVVAD
jgi:glycosyltransferase involved in cell wall biosynthesis